MANYLEQAKKKEPGLVKYSDYEITQALHEQYKAETGADIEFQTFAKDVGLELRQEPLNIPGQPGNEMSLETGPVNDPVNAALYDHGLKQVQPPFDAEKWMETLKAIPELTAKGMKRGAGGLMEAQGDLGRVPFGIPFPPGYEPKSEAMRRQKSQQTAQAIAQAEKGQQMASEAERRIKNITPTGQTFWQQAVSSAGVSLGQMTPGVVVGALTRSPHPLIASFGIITAGQAYADAKESGLPNDKALRHAAVSGLLESGTEYIPAKVLFNTGTGPFKRLVNFMAAELPGENISEVGQILSEWFHGMRDDVTAEDVIDTIALTSASTVLAGGPQAGISSYIDHLNNRGLRGVGREMQRNVDAAYPTQSAQEKAREALNPSHAQVMASPAEKAAESVSNEPIRPDNAPSGDQLVPNKAVPVQAPKTNRPAKDAAARKAKLIEYRGENRSLVDAPGFNAGWDDAAAGKADDGSYLPESQWGAYDDGYTAYREHTGQLATPVDSADVSNPPQTATHIEGDQSEPATPAVITDAVIESAANTPLDLKKARAGIMKDIDSAIKKAPDREVEAKKPHSYYDEIGHVVFDVPGDGKFKVLNTKANLTAFRRKVSASPGFNEPKNKPIAPSGGNFQKKGYSAHEFLAAGEYRNAYEMGKLTGNIAFGQDANNGAQLYTDTHEVEINGHLFFVGKNSAGKYRAIHKDTGFGVGKPAGSVKVAIMNARNAIDEAGPERTKEAMDKKLHISQDELEKRFNIMIDKIDGEKVSESIADSESAPKEPAAGKPKNIEDAKNDFNVKVKLEETGKINIGVDTVNTAEDAAHAVASYRRHPQENFLALVLDANNKPITVLRGALGVKDGATVDPGTMSGAVLSIPDAKSVYYAHNHPSGESTPSSADTNLTAKLRDLLDGSGIEFKGHVVLGIGREASFLPRDEDGKVTKLTITARPRGKTVPVTERVMRKRVKANREVTSPDKAKDIIRDYKGVGVLLLDNRHRVIGFLPVSKEEMNYLRNNEGAGLRKVLNAVHESNAAAAIIKTETDDTGENEARLNMGNMLSAANVKVLDAFYFDSNNEPVSIMESGGSVTTGSKFRSERPKEKGPGETYAGFIDSEYDESVIDRKKPIRREQIIRPFLKALNTTLYQGRVKGRGMERTMGYFGPKRRATRIRHMNDLETTAHELAHYIDDTTWRVKGRGGSKSSQPWIRGKHKNWETFARELRGVSYDAKKLHEGFAEFVRHWMTTPEYAQEVAPEFTKYWETEFIPNSPYGKAILKAQQGMSAWYAQSSRDRLRSIYGGDDTAKIYTDTMDTVYDRFRQAFLDDLHGLLKYETAVTGEDDAIALGPYQEARLSRAIASAVEGSMKYGPPRILGEGEWNYIDRNGEPSFLINSKGKAVDNPKFKSWGLRDVLKPVSHELDDWKLYVTARSASELMKQGRENLIKPDMINAGLELGKGKPHFEAAFQDWLKWNNAILDFAEQTQILTRKQRAKFKRDLYIPFYRVGQKGSTKRQKGIEGNIQPFKALRGGTANLNDIVENMTANATRIISEGVKNRARLKIVDYAMRENAGKFIERIPTDNAKVQIDKDQVINAFLEGLGLDPAQYNRAAKMGQGDPTIDAMLEEVKLNLSDMVGFWIHGQTPKGDNVIAVKRDGKTEYYEVADPLLYRAYVSLNRKFDHGKFWRFANAVRRIGQSTVTLTLDFATANMWRDAMHSFIFSQNGFKPGIDSALGMWSRLSRNANYRAFIANGGGMSSYLLDPVAFEDHIKHFYESRHINWRLVMHTPQRVLLGLELLADAAEMSTRLGEFRRATMRGRPVREAAYLAREISTDFSMRGDDISMNRLYNTVMFLKAGANSLDRVYRGFTRDTNRHAIMAKSGALAVLSAWLYAVNRGNPCYESLEDWQKDTYWHVFVPTGQDGGCESKYTHLHFPKIWEIGALSSAAERSVGAYLDSVEKGYKDGAKYAKHLQEIFVNMFSLDWASQFFEPLYEVYALNENRFTRRQIIPDRQKDLMPYAQSSPYTSVTLQRLAEKTAGLPKELQFSPRRAEALIRGYFNTWGMYGLMISDEILYGDQLPKWRLEEWPVARKFMVKHPLKNTIEQKAFYDLAHDAHMVVRTGKEMMLRQNAPLAEMHATDPLYSLEKATSNINKKVRAINNAMVQIYRNPDLSPLEKANERDRLQIMKNKVFSEAFDNLNAEVKKTK